MSANFCCYSKIQIISLFIPVERALIIRTRSRSVENESIHRCANYSRAKSVKYFRIVVVNGIPKHFDKHMQFPKQSNFKISYARSDER